MSNSNFETDIKYLWECIYGNPKACVRKWSDVECEDYQVVIGLLTHLLMEPLIDSSPELVLKSRAEYRAAADVVMNSGLGDVLVIDAESTVITFREELDFDKRLQVAKFVARHSQGFS